MAICMKCSAAIIDAAKFCAACGTPVAAPPASRAVDPLAATAAVAPVRPSSYGPPPQPPAQAGYAPAPQNPYAPATPPPITGSQPQAPSFGQVSPLAASFSGLPMAPPPPSWSAQPQIPSAPYGGAAQAFPPQQGYGTPPPQPGQPPPLYPAQPPYPAPPVAQQPPQPQQYGVPPQAPVQAAPPPQQAAWGIQSPTAFGVGARVLVQWADGNRYPATVTQSAPGQCLVTFPDGRQQWIEVQYLSSGI